MNIEKWIEYKKKRKELTVRVFKIAQEKWFEEKHIE